MRQTRLPLGLSFMKLGLLNPSFGDSATILVKVCAGFDMREISLG